MNETLNLIIQNFSNKVDCGTLYIDACLSIDFRFKMVTVLVFIMFALFFVMTGFLNNNIYNKKLTLKEHQQYTMFLRILFHITIMLFFFQLYLMFLIGFEH